MKDHRPHAAEVAAALHAALVSALPEALAVIRRQLNQVRVCAADDCARVFVRHRKQTFCSIRCQSRAYMRAWRQNGGKR
jgi:hypothetical protein